MAISESLLPEFDQEAAGVRKTLERVPEDKFDWKPHPKSGSMIWLAGHLANLPSWGTLTVAQDQL
ncbi:MAG: damage-inducible protein DinB, partial [Acidobacteria bacterium]|nr:damage-inducible protein DinB [Acidobacteriota bacterium]